MWKIQLFNLNFDERERDAAAAIVEGGWLTMGERIMSFESAFADLIGDDAQCVAVSSGTAALHMALGVAAGDQVIIPAV